MCKLKMPIKTWIEMYLKRQDRTFDTFQFMNINPFDHQNKSNCIGKYLVFSQGCKTVYILTLVKKLNTTPKVHFGQKHQITEPFVTCVADDGSFHLQIPGKFWTKLATLVSCLFSSVTTMLF